MLVDDAFGQPTPRDALVAAAIVVAAAAGKGSPSPVAVGIPSAPWGQSPCVSTCCGYSRPVWCIGEVSGRCVEVHLKSDGDALLTVACGLVESRLR